MLLRILLLGYLYGITSERKLLEELRMHLAWRWFTGLGFDQEIPHHSTFSKNRHGRFQQSRVFQELFERIVEQCMAVGLVQGEQMSVDGSFIQANADHHSRIPREQLAEVAKVNYGARKYLEELEQENGDGEPVHQQDKVSTTDPDATYMTKGNRAAELGYFNNYLIDNESCVIVGVQATAARLSQESAAARDMLDRYRERYGRSPQSLAADNTYGNGELLQWLDDRGITPYIRVKENPLGKSDLYGIDKFTYLPETELLCLSGRQTTEVRRHQSAEPDPPLLLDAEAVSGMLPEEPMHARQISHDRYPRLRSEPDRKPMHWPRLRVRHLAASRRKVEALFAELKNQIGLRRLRLRRMQVRTRAVLLGGDGAESETAGAVPQW